MATKEKSGFATIAQLRIDGEMTIYRAAELKQMLLGSMDSLPAGAGRIEIDLSAVSDIDCTGIQLLMMAKKTMQQRKGELHLAAHSPAVVEAFELLNLSGYFGDPIVIAPMT